MRTLCLVVVFLGLGCVIAGLYGAVHNQISFTVSPEYFTKYKFHQFRIPEVLSGRWGAALVGVSASWWMGGIIAVILMPSVFAVSPMPARIALALSGYMLVTVVTFLFGAAGLLGAWFFIPADASLPPRLESRGIVNVAAFLRAAVMHNAGYLGGAMGCVMALIKIRRSGCVGKINATRASEHGPVTGSG